MGVFDRLKKRSTEETAASNVNAVPQSKDIVAVAEQMLVEAKVDLSTMDVICLPMVEMATLGAGVAELLPSLRTVAQTVEVSGNGLYRLANAGAGDALKRSKKGFFWGALKTADGRSKMAQLENAGPLSATTQTIMPIDPATLMMAAALASIEKKLDEIAKMEKQILSFLEEDKEAQVEGDLKTLTNIIKEYKYNWNNQEYNQNHHKLALDIKRKADQNIIFYQKQVADVIKNNPALHLQQAASATQGSLQKHFKYYRMTLYIYAFASFLEVMLLGNFGEEYIRQISEKIEAYALEYRNLFTECSNRLENIAAGSVEALAMKGLGAVVKATGSLIGSIPFVKDGQVDEWLVNSGSQLEKISGENVRKLLAEFAKISDPGCAMFVDNLNHVEQIFNHTAAIYIDKDSIYLAKAISA